MQVDPLSQVFSALAHPARRAMLARLGLGETSVQELAKPLGLSAPAVSKHLKILERSGLISRGRNAHWRPCRLERAPMREAEAWIAEVEAMTEQRLDQMEAYLRKLQQPAGPTDSVTDKT